MRSKVEARVLDAAIEAFAQSGFEGTTAKDIAKKLGTTTMPMYYAFKNKEDLFEEALNEVITRSFEPSHFLLLLYQDQKPQDFHSLLFSALQLWYETLARPSARVLMHACLSSNNKWRETAESAISALVGVVATAIDREIQKKPRQKLSTDAGAAARALVMVLVHSKATGPRKLPPRNEKEEAMRIKDLLRYLLSGLSA